MIRGATWQAFDCPETADFRLASQWANAATPHPVLSPNTSPPDSFSLNSRYARWMLSAPALSLSMKRLLFASLLGVALAAHAAPPATIELHPGEHISIIGSGLADRMQHDGTLEAYIHEAHPKDDLSI